MIEVEKGGVGFRERPKGKGYEDFAFMIWVDYEMGKSRQDIVDMLRDKGLSRRDAAAYLDKFLDSCIRQSEIYGSLLI